MRKRISGLMTLVCLLVAAASALAAGTTVTTFTPFADMDFAAQGYMDLITAWEDETGNMVEDYSGLEDDLFMQQMQEMVTAGRADLVVVPLGSGLTKDQLVSVDELRAAAPDCGARRMDAMAERDGSVLLAPVRFNWEALYVNTDVLEANGVAVPTNYDELIIACASLAQKGILPLANAMCEWPEIVLDCTAMIGAPADQYGQQTSLDGAKAVTTALTQVGAFGLDPWNLTDEQAKQAFMEGAAAMRFDGSDLAELVPEARQEHVVAVALAGQVVAHMLHGAGAVLEVAVEDEVPLRGALAVGAHQEGRRVQVKGAAAVKGVHVPAQAHHDLGQAGVSLGQIDFLSFGKIDRHLVFLRS